MLRRTDNVNAEACQGIIAIGEGREKVPHN